MSKQQQDFITWFYRLSIGGLLSLTLFFAKSNYDDFQHMKIDVEEDKRAHAVQAKINEQLEARIINIERIATTNY